MKCTHDVVTLSRLPYRSDLPAEEVMAYHLYQGSLPEEALGRDCVCFSCDGRDSIQAIVLLHDMRKGLVCSGG